MSYTIPQQPDASLRWRTFPTESLYGGDENNKNELGNLISGCPYYVTLPSFRDWEHNLQLVCHEANYVYNSVYRLSIPMVSGPEEWPANYGDDSDEDDEPEGLASDYPHAGPPPEAKSNGWRLRLCPETDMVDLSCLDDVPGVGSFFGSKFIGREAVMSSFLFDSQAYDPRGVGIAGLVMGREGPKEVEELYHGVCTTLYIHPHPEAKEGFTRYFEGFGMTQKRSKNKHTFYVAAPISMASARYDSESLFVPTDLYDDEEEEVGLFRAVPIMPATNTAQTVAVAETYEADEDGDPRAADIQRGLDMGRTTIQLPLLWGGPKHNVFFWRRLLTMLDIKADIDNKVRYLIASWPNSRRTEQVHTRAGFLDLVRTTDQQRLRALARSGAEDELMRGWDVNTQRTVAISIPPRSQIRAIRSSAQFRKMLSTSSYVPEVAGAWVFKAEACGDLPVDELYLDSDTAANPAERRSSLKQYHVPDIIAMVQEGGVVDLKKHRPGLIVMGLE